MGWSGLSFRWPGRRKPATDASARRWLVVDVESSGLDAARDRLLAIAAVAVHFDEDFRQPRIELADSFEVFIAQPADSIREVDKHNILIHGIGVGAQRAGEDPRTALSAWLTFAGTSPLVAYHSAFDETMINRAMQRVCGRKPPNSWLDLEPLAAVLHEDPRRRALDHWLARHHIDCLLRHQAAADTLATAQLLLSLWPPLRQRVDGRFERVVDLAASHRFLPGRSG